MEAEDVSERVKWEIKRVAAAFGIEKWEMAQSNSPLDVRLCGIVAGVTLRWEHQKDNGALLCLELSHDVAKGRRWCSVNNFSNPRGEEMWMVHREPQYHALMARGLYRLGVEVPQVLAQINYPLTAHERLELRLSLPREFWPQTWLDEEAK